MTLPRREREEKGERKILAQGYTAEASPLASLGSETAIPPNIRTLVSEAKEDTSDGPGDISGE